MLGNKFTIEFYDGMLVVKNNTTDVFYNCLIDLKNIFDHSVIFETTDFGPMESRVFNSVNNNFSAAWKNETFILDVYSNNIHLYHKRINDKKRCYVLFSNKKFESLIEQLVIGLNRYSTITILHYTVNYTSKLEYPNLLNVRYDVSGDVKDGQYMQFIKPKIFLDVLNMGYDGCVFLDADIQVRPNIDDLLNHIHDIEDGPIFQKAAWDYTVADGNFVPGPILTDYLGLELSTIHENMPNQKFPQGVTNVLIFNQSHKHLFEEWENVCFSNEIDSIRKQEFLHDELILNCLQWKMNIKPKQFKFFVNVLSVDDVHFFYSHEKKYIENLDMNEFQLGHPFQSFIPYEMNKTKGFHCVKDVGIANRINNYIYNNDYLIGKI